VLGSYTGAIGIPQFLPSSIVQYAISYDGNKQIDLRTSQADAIGSVANYLKQNGWENGRPVVWEIAPDAGSQGIAQAAADGQPEPHWPLQQLLRAGLLLNQPGLDMASEAGTPVTVVDLPSPGLPTEYKLGLKNFYVLTRYNRSFFYALAVYQLGEKIKQQLEASGDLDSNGAPTSMSPPSVPPGTAAAPMGMTAPAVMPGTTAPSPVPRSLPTPAPAAPPAPMGRPAPTPSPAPDTE
jgi:membrane-bound lytic murein transglycosylase B